MSSIDLFGPDNKEYTNTPANSPYPPPKINVTKKFKKNKSHYKYKKQCLKKRDV